MKASASISIGDRYKSVDVELDSTSESDVKFAKQCFRLLLKLKKILKKLHWMLMEGQ